MSHFRVPILILLFLSIMSAMTVHAASLDLKVDRVVVAPEQQQNIRVICDNMQGKDSCIGTLHVYVEHNLSSRIEVGKQKVNLEAGAKKTFQFAWQPEEDYWGCSVKAELVVSQASAVKSNRYDFVVTRNLVKASPAMGVSHSGGSLNTDQLDERASEFADGGIPLLEIFSWTPDLWEHINPRESSWKAGQGGFPESVKSISTLIERAHTRGMKVYSYAQNSFRGKIGEDWSQSNTEDLLFPDPEAKVIGRRSGDAFVAYSNPFNIKTLNRGLDEYAEALKRFEFDGIRWDGHPGIFYTPISDWISRCNGSTSSYPYNDKGQPLVPDDPDGTNAQLVRYTYDRIGKKLPKLKWGFNITMGPREIGGHNTRFPQMFRMLATGNMILHESHVHCGPDGRPYIASNQRWNTIQDDLAYSSELLHILGGYIYRGDVGIGRNEPFLKHLFSMYFASRTRVFGVNPWYGSIPDAGKFPLDYTRFALRYNKFLFHPSLNRINPQVPLQRISVSSNAPFPVRFESTCYDLFQDQKLYTVINLLNSPLTEQVNVFNTPEPKLAEKTVVNIRTPLGLDAKTARYYVLSPEWEQRAILVKPESPTHPVVSINVPSFKYWAMVICEYPVISENKDKASQNQSFLPVYD